MSDVQRFKVILLRRHGFLTAPPLYFGGKNVTNEQKENIRAMRLDGMTPTQISDALGLSINTVKSFCKRNDLTTAAMSEAKGLCRQCRQPMEPTRGKPKFFCGNSCRYTWWNKNRAKAVEA